MGASWSEGKRKRKEKEGEMREEEERERERKKKWVSGFRVLKLEFIVFSVFRKKFRFLLF